MACLILRPIVFDREQTSRPRASSRWKNIQIFRCLHIAIFTTNTTMSTTDKENTANLNVSISRRAKKDAKRLALSPMKDNSTLNTDCSVDIYRYQY